MTDPTPSERRFALVIAHPGHELRVYNWLESARPKACVFTDGSGHTGKSRLPSTRAIFDPLGIEAGPVFGRWTDPQIYSEVLGANVAPFVAATRELADWLEAEQATDVAGDALEGYNPSHDLCRYLINAAVALVEKKTGRVLGNYDFLLEGASNACPEALRKRAICLKLDEEDLKRKLAAAQGYAELKHEVDAALAKFGVAPFSVEYLRPVVPPDTIPQLPEVPPFYERHGEKQVAQGYYKVVLRYREHMLPLVQQVWKELGL